MEPSPRLPCRDRRAPNSRTIGAVSDSTLLTFGGLVAGLVLAGWLARRQLRFGTPDTAVLGDVLIRAASKGDVVMMVLCREHHLEVVQAAGVAEREAHARFPGCRLLAPDSSDTPHAYQRVAHVAKWLGLSQAHLPQLVVFGPMAGFQARAALGRNSTSDSEQAVDAITVKLGSTESSGRWPPCCPSASCGQRSGALLARPSRHSHPKRDCQNITLSDKMSGVELA